MRSVVVVSAVRTPIGRLGGALAHVRPDDLAAIAIRAAVERAGVAPSAVEDVFFGAANQAGEDNRNVGRMAALLAGLPVETGGATFNRLCGSSLQAINSAAHAIAWGEADVIVAGGVESMTRAPFVTTKAEKAFDRAVRTYDTTLGWRMTNPRMPAEWTIPLGATAEKVARERGISREDQDGFALLSQRRCAAAVARGAFDAELVAVGEVSRDEHPRPETSAAGLAKLEPAFDRDGTVTAGNSSGLNDGAAALVLAEEGTAKRLGLTALARVVATAAAGVAPDLMGLGPIPAVRKLLRGAGLRVVDLDLVEINEAFASQALACLRDLEFDPERTNVNGGAIALGHPLGASGARLATTLLHELRRRGGGRGLATMCVGVGQGIATLFESTG